MTPAGPGLANRAREECAYSTRAIEDQAGYPVRRKLRKLGGNIIDAGSLAGDLVEQRDGGLDLQLTGKDRRLVAPDSIAIVDREAWSPGRTTWLPSFALISRTSFTFKASLRTAAFSRALAAACFNALTFACCSSWRAQCRP